MCIFQKKKNTTVRLKSKTYSVVTSTRYGMDLYFIFFFCLNIVHHDKKTGTRRIASAPLSFATTDPPTYPLFRWRFSSWEHVTKGKSRFARTGFSVGDHRQGNAESVVLALSFSIKFFSFATVLLPLAMEWHRHPSPRRAKRDSADEIPNTLCLYLERGNRHRHHQDFTRVVGNLKGLFYT